MFPMLNVYYRGQHSASTLVGFDYLDPNQPIGTNFSSDAFNQYQPVVQTFQIGQP